MGLESLALLFAGASTVTQISAANQRSRAAKLQARQRELASQRERRRAIREMQMRRATALASLQAQGGLSSSAYGGGVESSGSRLSEALGYQAQYNALSSGIEKRLQRAANLDAFSTGFGSLASIDYEELFGGR